MTKQVTPATTETAFSCPHCGAFTTQHWFNLLARANDEDARKPNLPDAQAREYFEKANEIPPEAKAKLLEWCDKVAEGNTFFEDVGKFESTRLTVQNLNISECFNCKKQAVWVHRTLAYPVSKLGPNANADLPADIVRDFDEARAIVNVSPRGAAALLRLSVQKLCLHLGEAGRNIDDDIASLVRKGLDPLIQQALDIVRVVGNEAVHPGSLDLRDDQEVALRLFDLINAISQQMISHPKTIKDLYAKLPETKRAAIDARNAKSKGQAG